MHKILILIDKDYISFSVSVNDVSNENLNNTNIINTKNLRFTENYIIENLELVATFFQLIIIKNQIKKARIENIEISVTILELLKLLTNIEEVIFTEDKKLNYTISSLLLENKNLERIECYGLPEILFYKFPNGIVETRGEILFTSEFMEYNNIKTYSQIFNKEKITIDGFLDDVELDDLDYFFKENERLKKILIKKYNKKNLVSILKLLRSYCSKKILIIIYEDKETTDAIIKDVDFFRKLEKQYNINIRIKYSKEYKEKNQVKQLNITMFKTIAILLIIMGLLAFMIIKFTEKKEKEHFDVNLQIINDVIDDAVDDSDDLVDSTVVLPEVSNPVEENDNQDNTQSKDTYVSPYYTNYEQVYEKLLSINNDTVGWLTVKNTKVNYPVVQTDNNDYYLNHAFDKRKNLAGWIFVDYRNNMNELDQNTIIYGHNVHKNELLFGSLKNVLDESWYTNKENFNITFSIKGQEMSWEIFSIYTVEKTNDYLITKFNSSKSFINYVNDKKEKSIVDFNVEVKEDDKILTLSTCYNNSNYRLVVHAKKIS